MTWVVKGVCNGDSNHSNHDNSCLSNDNVILAAKLWYKIRPADLFVGFAHLKTGSAMLTIQSGSHAHLTQMYSRQFYTCTL